jgi:hypothetical protein
MPNQFFRSCRGDRPNPVLHFRFDGHDGWTKLRRMIDPNRPRLPRQVHYRPSLRLVSWCLLVVAVAGSLRAAPTFLEKRFELPAGFRIYRAADSDLTGGSYDIAFDGQGRLLVGDGNAVRRLEDRDGDGVYDGYEIIATGLGWRGPQGLLVYGDRLYAVGGDGIQVFDGYLSQGGLTHRGRLGQPLNTGGDHCRIQLSGLVRAAGVGVPDFSGWPGVGMPGDRGAQSAQSRDELPRRSVQPRQ